MKYSIILSLVLLAAVTNQANAFGPTGLGKNIASSSILRSVRAHQDVSDIGFVRPNSPSLRYGQLAQQQAVVGGDLGFAFQQDVINFFRKAVLVILDTSMEKPERISL